MDPASLTRAEAAERVALLSVNRYDIDVDMRGLLEGEVIESRSTVSFSCSEPGASTFVDCTAEVTSAVLNGTELDLATIDRGRIPLPGLAADNTLVVTARQADTNTSQGIQRTVDPSDKLVYVWTSFECDDARRVWACFDQPDLKALHRFVVTAPESWTVTSNMHAEDVTDAADGGRVWTFPDTPPLSTYVVVVNAGPFHEIREQRGDHSLGLYCRQSLKQFLERDAQFLLDVTEQGLAWFGEQFDQPFPEAHYDQVFVPNMGGAMENWGCVTWTDTVLWRSDPTHSQRAVVASVTLHEMAHMWFGDLVTMQWWDDLWLNEAFASWAATWASANATEFTDAWASFLVGRELDAYRIDMGPATHPIRGDVADVSSAMANFDSITYAKGEAVLKQLSAYIGEAAFVQGLRDYFRDHAWGNTRLEDLMTAFGNAAGRDLGAWTADWLDRAGNDTLTLTEGEISAVAPDGGEPRPHRIDVASYAVDDDGLTLVGTTEVVTEGRRTPVSLPEADLHLPDPADLTFAAIRTDEASLKRLVEGAGQLPEPINRAMAVATAWDMLTKGELDSAATLECVLGVLATETSAAVVEAFLALAREVAEQWSPLATIADRQARVADTAASLADNPDLRQAALRVLAATAATPGHEQLVADADDIDLAWRLQVRRAERGAEDAAQVQALLDRDPDPDAWVRALQVKAARPDSGTKDEVWAELFDKKTVPAGSPTAMTATAFWRPSQTELLLPYAHRYLDEMANVLGGGMLSRLSLVRSMLPAIGDEAFVERAQALADAPDTNPTVRSIVLTGLDALVRMRRARG
ncbi:MAG TPA: aminopeptidase N [Nocardioides sp.]|nr:aminopeptidase N [Nocardioides sp.]